VSRLFLETQCHDHWVRSYTQPSPTKSCISLWLVPCRTADAAATVDALMRWFAVFDVVVLWISDRGSHFKNEVVQRVQKELKAKHHFTTANFPWSNGTTESACKQVICAFRAVLLELRMYADEWSEVVYMVQSVLNNALSTRLNKRTPMRVFTGHAEIVGVKDTYYDVHRVQRWALWYLTLFTTVCTNAGLELEIIYV
jgi:transposase InsO family protein